MEGEEGERERGIERIERKSLRCKYFVTNGRSFSQQRRLQCAVEGWDVKDSLRMNRPSMSSAAAGWSIGTMCPACATCTRERAPEPAGPWATLAEPARVPSPRTQGASSAPLNSSWPGQVNPSGTSNMDGAISSRLNCWKVTTALTAFVKFQSPAKMDLIPSEIGFSSNYLKSNFKSNSNLTQI